MKTKFAVWGLMCVAVLSAGQLEAVRIMRVIGGTAPGVRILDEVPDCWFSFAEKQIAFSIEAPSTFRQEIVAKNAQGQLLEYFATATHTPPTGNEVVQVHLYDPVRNAKNQLTAWTEVRYYGKSQTTYVIRVSGVQYNGSGLVLSGFTVDIKPNVFLSGTISTQIGEGIPGVTVTALLTKEVTSTVHTNSLGTYQIAVPSSWSGTLTPTLENYRFTPVSKSYETVTQSLINQNFSGKQIVTVTISGVIQDPGGVGISGVSLDGFIDPVTTNSSGVYSGSVESGTTIVIRPVKECYAFTPEQRTYDPIIASLVNQDYSGARIAMIPNVQGKTPAAAETAILAASLKVGMVHFVYSPTVASGVVLRQSPAAGSCAAKNSAVHLAVSLGSHPAAMLKAWGNNASNIRSTPAGKDFVAVAGGGAHAVALKNSGALAAWGSNASGQCTVPAGIFESIACGADFSAGIQSNGSLAAWGLGTDGQTTVPAGNTFVAIGTGDKHALAVRVDGSIAAWGSNAGGQCTVPAGKRFVAVDGGENFSAGVTDGGGLVAWGSNDSGQLNVPDGNDFVAVTAGGKHAIALRTNGTLAAWGANDQGQCNAPAEAGFVAIAAGKSFSAALSADGTVTAWGKNDQGQSSPPDNLSFLSMDAGADFGAGIYDLRGDLSNNGSVDIDDLALIIPEFFNLHCQAPTWCGMADINQNGRVNLEDLAILSREWMIGVSPIPNGLAAHWPMDDNAANKTVIDAGDNHLNGTAQQNTSVLTTAGKIGTSLSFNGTADSVDCGTNAALLGDAWTVCAWIQCTDTATPIPVSFGGNYCCIKLQNNGKGKPMIHLGQTNYRYFAASAWTTLKDGQWHHVAFSAPGKGQTDIQQAKMYLDGVAVAGDTAVTTGPQTDKSHVYLGANPSVGTQWFGGAMDDVMLFNRVLTENEIRRVMNR